MSHCIPHHMGITSRAKYWSRPISMSSAAHMVMALQIIGKKVKMLCQRFCTSSDSSSSFFSSPSTTNASLVEAFRTIAGPDAAAAAASPAVGRMTCNGSRVFSGLSASSRSGDLTRLAVDESAAACLRFATLPCPPPKPPKLDPPSPLEGPVVTELTNVCAASDSSRAPKLAVSAFPTLADP